MNQEERQALYANIASGQSLKSELYGRLVSLGVASKKTTIKGCTLIPSGAVAYTIKWLGEPLIERCLAQASSKYGSQLSDYLDILKNTGRAREIIEQVLSPAVSATPTKAVSAIRKLITKHFCCGKRNIGLETCIQICKYKDARFSFDVIMREGGISPGSGPDRFRGVDKMLIGEKLPSNDVVQCLASVLYARLKRARLDEILSAFEQFCSSIAHQTYVTLIKHRTINVLKDLVLLHLQGKGWHVVQEGVKVRSCLSEFSGAPAGVGDPVFTAVIQRKDRRVLLHVISAYAATHKHKECPGKLRVARYSLNAVGGRRVFRPQAPPEAFLILDGPWTKLFGHTGRAEKAFKESGWKGVIDARTILCGDLPHY